MRVLLLLDSLAPGGTETSTVLLASLLPDYGIDPTIAVLGPADPDLSELADSHGTRVVAVPGTNVGTRVRGMRGLLRREQPDLLHTALYRSDQLGRWAAIGTGVPVLSSFVSTPYVAERFADPHIRPWKLRVTQLVDAATAHLLADSFHAVSEGVRAVNGRALRISPERIHVVERGRDAGALGAGTNRRSAVRAELEIDDAVPMILNIGRQEYAKGQVDLVRASALLGANGVAHQMVIAGKAGNATVDVERAIADPANGDANVRLLGHRNDIGALLSAADVVVISSLFEGTAGAALEAMALGVPIVSTDLAGVRGILEHEETALLVRIGEATPMTAAIERIVTEPDLAQRLAENGRATFEARFTLDHSARATAAMYRSIVRES